MQLPALSRIHGIHPWQVPLLTDDEQAVYLQDIAART